MIKLTFCLRRKPELSRAEFQTYWRETHGPIVEKHRAVLGFVAYHQIHTIDDPTSTALADVRGAPPAFDGVAEDDLGLTRRFGCGHDQCRRTRSRARIAGR